MNLPIQTIFRTLAIVVTGLLMWLFPAETEWKSIVASLGFGHYALSIYYAKHQINSLFNDRSFAIPVIATTILGVALYLGTFPLVIVFAVHHVFNEVYLLGRKLPEMSKRNQDLLRCSTLFLHTFAYLAILRGYTPLNQITTYIWLTGYAVSYLFFLVVLWRVRRAFNLVSLIENSALELGTLLIFGLSYVVDISFLDVVCYHFVFWCFLPLPKLAQRGHVAVRQYLLLTAAATGAFLLLSPIGVRSYAILGSVFFNQFLLWSYVHIVSSLALSRSQPRWITRWFWNPQPAR